MWNKRKDDDFSARPATPTPTPAPTIAPEATRRETPMPPQPQPVAPAAPVRTVESETARGSAVIGKSVVLKGQIVSREDLYIDGDVEGSVELPEHRLTVGMHGRVQAGIKAREIVIVGTVNGNAEASDKIDIRKEAKMIGDLKTARIMIEDGAFFKGSIDITRVDPAAAKKPVAPVSSAPAPSPVTTMPQATPMPAPTAATPSSAVQPPVSGEPTRR